MVAYREHTIEQMREIKDEQDYHDRLEAEYQAAEAARAERPAVYPEYDHDERGHLFPEADDPAAFKNGRAA